MRTALAGLEAVGDSGVAPEILLPRDVVVVMDPNAMAAVATRLVGGLSSVPTEAGQ